MELNCRECKLRDSCVRESSQAPGVKRMILQTFDEGRDTQELWRELQKECLLLAQAEEARRRRPSLLSQRLKGDIEPVDGAETTIDGSGLGSNDAAKQDGPVTSSPPEEELAAVRKPASGPIYAHLRVASTGNRFSLPSQGEVIVGRSDYAKNIIADIDLSKEGDVFLVVTRRHVKIIARQRQHYVEDPGSTNSTKLNGTIIENSELGPLNPGDHLWLGGCVLVYGVESQLEPELA